MTHRLTVRVPAETYTRLRREAFEGATTISALVNTALSSSRTTPAATPAPPPLAPTREDEPTSIVGRVMQGREP